MNHRTVRRTELHDYLQQLSSTLTSLKNGTTSPDAIKIVICNETCDLDSTACALTYSFFLQKTKTNNSTVILPVLNTSRIDFPLRSDVVALLCHYQIPVESLVFVEDVSFIRDSEKLSERLQVVLVDHNYPSDCCLWLVGKVVEVIDHHEQLFHAVPLKNCRHSVIEKVGSCSTLVAEQMLKHGGGRGCERRSESGDDPHHFQIDSTSAAILLAAILVDTVCGSPAAGRETPKDSDAVARLDETAQLPYNHGRFFEWLMSAKFDISRLSTSDLLRKDAKLVVVGETRILMCSISAPFSAISSRNDLASSLEQAKINSGSAAVVILCLSYTNPGFPDDCKRELGIYSDDCDLLVSLASWFQTNKRVDLILSPLNGHGGSENGRVELLSSNSHDDSGTTSPVFVNLILGDRMIVFCQSNVRASRKQILPLVEEFLRSRNNKTEK